MGFVLSRSRRSPSIDDVLIALHQVGLKATADPHRGGSEYGFELGDGSSLALSFVDAPHPDLKAIAFTTGWLGTELEPTVSHLVVVLYAPEKAEVGSSELQLMRSVAAVADATDAVGARIGFGLNYLTIGDFRTSVEELNSGEAVPSRLAVGCDVAVPRDGHVSILSSGLEGYRCEEFVVRAPQARIGEALDLLWDLADQVRASVDGRDSLTVAAESDGVLGQPPKRVPSPTMDGKEVIEVVLAIH